jgi:hypothetical protein
VDRQGPLGHLPFPPEVINNPGAVARFPANKPDGSLTRSFAEIANIRDPDGAWTITGKDWNRGAGASVRFNDASFGVFSRLVVLGTCVYLLRDRSDERGNQSFGFFRSDYTPRKAAVYLHNLTTILADRSKPARPGSLSYAIARQPATVHEMLLRKSDGTFALIVWGERLEGSDDVTVRLGEAYPGVTIYDPTVGTKPVRSLDDVTSLKLTLSDHPQRENNGRRSHANAHRKK